MYMLYVCIRICMHVDTLSSVGHLASGGQDPDHCHSAEDHYGCESHTPGRRR